MAILIRNLILSLTLLRMQNTTEQNIHQYSQKLSTYHDEYIKDLPIELFKTIDEKRIKNEFYVLSNAYTSEEHEQQIYCKYEKGKDRYTDIRVYKHNEIKIEHIEHFYINASPMRSALNNQTYAIFAQAPTPKGVEHFWYAVYHLNVKRIVMLCAFQDPRRGVQAQKYWPETNLQVKLFKVNLSVKCLSTQKIDDQLTKTVIIVKGQQGEKIVQHIHWTGWGDMKKPLGEKSEGLFGDLVRDAIHMIENKELFVIHCSAGIGRTGTLGTMIEALRMAKQTKSLSVFRIVDNMRRHRMGCVQTFEQYLFLYQQLQKML